jgi:chromate transport protein ChrA
VEEGELKSGMYVSKILRSSAPAAISILVISVIAIFRFKLNSVWLIVGAAIVGWIMPRGRFL